DTADHENLCRPPDPACYLLFSGAGMMESQSLGPDRFSPRARDARAVRQRKLREPARPAARHSQSQAARPGSRRPPAERAGAVATARPQAVSVAPARRATPGAALRAIDPAERLGIDLASLRTVEDVRTVFAPVWTAISRGEIAPVEGARVARRLRVHLRVLRRFARLGSHAAFPADEE